MPNRPIAHILYDVDIEASERTTVGLLLRQAQRRGDHVFVRHHDGASWQGVTWRAFAFDPNNPGFIPQDRASDGTLTPLDGTNPSITYTVSGLPAGATFDPVTAQVFRVNILEATDAPQIEEMQLLIDE